MVFGMFTESPLGTILHHLSAWHITRVTTLWFRITSIGSTITSSHDTITTKKDKNRKIFHLFIFTLFVIFFYKIKKKLFEKEILNSYFQ